MGFGRERGLPWAWHSQEATGCGQKSGSEWGDKQELGGCVTSACTSWIQEESEVPSKELELMEGGGQEVAWNVEGEGRRGGVSAWELCLGWSVDKEKSDTGQAVELHFESESFILLLIQSI